MIKDPKDKAIYPSKQYAQSKTKEMRRRGYRYAHIEYVWHPRAESYLTQKGYVVVLSKEGHRPEEYLARDGSVFVRYIGPPSRFYRLRGVPGLRKYPAVRMGGVR